MMSNTIYGTGDEMAFTKKLDEKGAGEWPVYGQVSRNHDIEKTYRRK